MASPNQDQMAVDPAQTTPDPNPNPNPASNSTTNANTDQTAGTATAPGQQLPMLSTAQGWYETPDQAYQRRCRDTAKTRLAEAMKLLQDGQAVQHSLVVEQMGKRLFGQNEMQARIDAVNKGVDDRKASDARVAARIAQSGTETTSSDYMDREHYGHGI